MQFAKISADDLQHLLQLADILFAEQESARTDLQQQADTIFPIGQPGPTWYQWYEVSLRHHAGAYFQALLGEDALRDIVSSPNQIVATKAVLEEFDSVEFSDEQREAIQPQLGAIFAMATSIANSLRAMLTFGLYLNDLVALVREQGPNADNALFSAVKIDPTVLACRPVAERVSKAVMLDDQQFLANLRKAMAAKLSAREQKNYQQMRLVLQALYETGAGRLSKQDLYALFVDQLKLVRGDTASGDSDTANNLRQFAYQFLKLKGVS